MTDWPDVPILGVIRSRREQPASLVRSYAMGGAWLHLLPRLALGRVVLIGPPEPGLVDLLERRATSLTFVDRGRSLGEASTADLLLLGPSHSARGSRRRAEVRHAIGEVVGGGGWVVEDLLTWRGAPSRQVAADATEVIYRAVPMHGPVRAAWPLGDAAMGAWLRTTGFGRETRSEERLAAAGRRLRDAIRGARRRPTAVAVPNEPSTIMVESAGRRRRAVLSLARAGAAMVARGEAGYLRLAGLERRLVIHGVVSGPPRWLTEMAAGSAEIGGHRVALAAPGEFPTQKILILLAPAGDAPPDIVVKVGRHPAVNDRIAAAVRAMRLIAHGDLAAAGSVPKIEFAGMADGIQVVAETATSGASFALVTTARADCPWAAAGRDWITELGARSARPASAVETADGLGELLERMPTGLLAGPERNFLHGIVGELRGCDRVPTVLQHGDPGPWNMRADVTTGGLSVLDWENAEPRGVPLWDLAYFLRSSGVLVAIRAGVADRMARGVFFVTDPELRRISRDAVAAYAARVGLDSRAIRPLMFHHWVYQAVKESTRVPSADAQRAIFLRTLRWFVAHRDDGAVLEVFDPDPT
jgi:hypothetical protein